jgi:hypothetical protein
LSQHRSTGEGQATDGEDRSGNPAHLPQTQRLFAQAVVQLGLFASQRHVRRHRFEEL